MRRFSLKPPPGVDESEAPDPEVDLPDRPEEVPPLPAIDEGKANADAEAAAAAEAARAAETARAARAASAATAASAASASAASASSASSAAAAAAAASTDDSRRISVEDADAAVAAAVASSERSASVAMQARDTTIESLLAKIKEQDAELHKLRTASVRRKDDLGSLEAQVAKVSHLLASRSAELVAAQAELAQRAERLSEIDMERATALGRLEVVQAEMDSIEERTGKEIKTLRAKLAKAVKARDVFEASATESATTLKEKSAMVEVLKDECADTGREMEGMRARIREQEQEIENLTPAPEGAINSNEVSLSARSYSEKMMVTLRDDALEAKDMQIKLLNTRCEALSENIDTVEQEVTKLQVDLKEKEETVRKRQARISILEVNNDGLNLELKKLMGREAAIEVTTKQNASLLALLQQTEEKTSQLERGHDDQVTMVDLEKGKVRRLLTQLADAEAQLIVYKRDLKKARKDLSTGKMQWEGEQATASVELYELRKSAKERTESIQDELRIRREKQYLLLNKLQVKKQRGKRIAAVEGPSTFQD